MNLIFLKRMSEKEQIEAFADDLDRLVDRYRREFDLSYASVIGTLNMKAHLLCAEAGRGDVNEE